VALSLLLSRGQDQGPAGCLISKDYATPGEAVLPRRVTPVEGPGTRDKTRTRASDSDKAFT